MNRVRGLREVASISRTLLAQKVGVSPQAVAKWESGESDPKWDLAPMIASALGCSIGDLFITPAGNEQSA